MKIKFNCWTGQEMLEVHTLQLDGEKLEGFHHFVESDENDEPCMRLSEDAGHIFLQFTGLIDREEKEVFEGDIVEMHQFLFDGNEYENQLNGIIRKGEYGWLLTQIKCLPYSRYTSENDGTGENYLINFYGLHEESFTKIGNIYQNEY